MLGWAEGIVKYLEIGKLPKDRGEALKVRNRVARFTVVNGVLYRQDYSTSLLMCMSQEEV